MASRQKKFLVSFKLKGEGVRSDEVKAQDAACALGLLLDELDDENAEFEWLLIRSGFLIRSEKKDPKPRKQATLAEVFEVEEKVKSERSFDQLPAEIQKAYFEGLAGK